jgi:glycine betaine/proline transport system substrate-binding protein
MLKKEKYRISLYCLIFCFLFMTAFLPNLIYAGSKGKIKLADQGFDSIRTHNRIVGFILEHGYGYTPEYVFGETITTINGVARGDLDVHMEVWVQNVQKVFDEGISNGKFVDLGSNFPDSWQGWLVPNYVIEGDPKRGIKPSAPDLKSVNDMSKYWEVFKDPGDPTKGAFYSCIPGWACQEINELKFKAYGLDEHFNIIVPGSDAALSASMASAYKKGKPWFGYYWAPTWVLGKLDMTPLAEPEFDSKLWTKDKRYGCAYPSVNVNIIATASLPKRAPEVVEFLKNYETTLKLNNRMLAYKKDQGADAAETAIWFLNNHQNRWTEWVPADVAAKVKDALK